MHQFDIKHNETESHGIFYIVVDGKKEAEMTYSKAGTKTIIIDHIGVNDSLSGTGAGRQLVQAGVEYARDEGLKVIPLCPFAKVQIQRHKEWQDVLQD